MTDRDDNKSVGGSAADLERIELLLRSASPFVPEHAMPDDLVARALSRSRGRVVAHRRYVFVGAGGATALAAVSFAWALWAVVRPSEMPRAPMAKGHAVAAPALQEIDALRAHERRASARAGTVSRQRTSLTRLTQRRLRHRRRRYHVPNVDRLALAVIPRTVHSDSAPRIAFAAHVNPAPVQNCWTTEEVQQTHYVLVSPGIVTEGSGDAERVTPVLVPLQLDSDQTTNDSKADSSGRTPDSY